MNRKPERSKMVQQYISQLTDADLMHVLKETTEQHERQKAFLDDLKFELGARQVKSQCQSEDPNDMCVRCTCWKSARSACT
jgi:hypothetical protein